MTFESAQIAKEEQRQVIVKRAGKFDEDDIGKIVECVVDPGKPRERAFANVAFVSGKARERIHVGDIFFHDDAPVEIAVEEDAASEKAPAAAH